MSEKNSRERTAPPSGIPHSEIRNQHSAESEQHVLSALMLDDTGEAWAIAIQCGVKPAAFYQPCNQVIWETIAALRERGTPTTLDVVMEELRTTGKLDAAGGMAYLVEVSGKIPTTALLRYHAEQIVLLWQLRHALTVATQLSEGVKTFTTREDFAKLCGDIGQRLIRFGHRTAPRTIAEQVASVRDDVLARASGKIDKSGWIFSGMPQFDRTLLPFGSAREDYFVIIAGGSGHGKSALMRQWSGAALLDGRRVVYYTRETSIEGFIEQLAASWCSIDLRRVEQTPRDRLDDFTQKCAWLENEIADRRLWVVQHEAATPLLYVEDLARHYRAFAHLHGHPDMVVVDYAQLFGVDPTKKRCNSREQEVATVSHTLQALCREAGKVWLVGAQYNETGLRDMRTVKRDENGNIIHRMPCAGDLRESQALYHDADRVICIYRPPEDAAGRDQSGPVVGHYPEQWLVQIKRRKGGLGYVRCAFEAPFTRFAELGRHDTAAPAPAPGMTKNQWKNQK